MASKCKCNLTTIHSRVDEAVLYTMDELDQALDKEDVKMVSINVAGIEKEYGLYGLPLLIHFNGNIPRVFDGKTLISFSC